MKVLRLDTIQVRAYRQNREAYIEAVTIFTGRQSCQLRTPDGRLLKNIRIANDPHEQGPPAKKRMLCLLSTGEVVRAAYPHELELFDKALAVDPKKIGAIQLDDGKLYYIRDMVPESETEAELEDDETEFAIVQTSGPSASA